MILFGIYHLPSQKDQYNFDLITLALALHNINKLILAGEFNAEESDLCLGFFLFELEFP